MSRIGTVFVVCLLACLLCLPVMAAEGRIPLHEPTVLAGDGHYVVTRNIVGSGLGPVIEIMAPQVDLDLNGFQLIEPSGTFPVIRIGGPVINIRIHNGTLMGMAGLEAPGGGDKLVVEDVRVTGGMGTAIRVEDTARVVIRRTVIEGSASGGIVIDSPGPHMATIEGNVIRGVGGHGIFFRSGSAGILNNRVNAAGVGIFLASASGSLVSENTVFGAGDTGIFLRDSKGNKLFDNVVRESSSHGIHIDASSLDNLVLNNVATGNGFGLPGGHGLFVEGDRNVAERNVLNGNNGFGLRLAAVALDNTFGRNTARGNLGAAPGPCAGGPSGLFPPNSCNDGFGNDTYGDNLISVPF